MYGKATYIMRAGIGVAAMKQQEHNRTARIEARIAPGGSRRRAPRRGNSGPLGQRFCRGRRAGRRPENGRRSGSDPAFTRSAGTICIDAAESAATVGRPSARAGTPPCSDRGVRVTARFRIEALSGDPTAHAFRADRPPLILSIPHRNRANRSVCR